MKREELEARIGNCIHKEDGRRDFLPLYADPDVMREIVAALSEPYRGKVDFVVSPEPMGLILGSMLARELGVGFVALRKGREGKRHWEDSILAPYIDHRDQVQTLELENGLIPAGSRILPHVRYRSLTRGRPAAKPGMPFFAVRTRRINRPVWPCAVTTRTGSSRLCTGCSAI